MPGHHHIGDASRVFGLALDALASVRAARRRHGDPVAENLLLRHQLAFLTWPTRRWRVRFRRLDQQLWVLMSRLRRDWQTHVLFIGPDTVVR